MGSKKTKTKNEPWAPAQPHILKGMQATSDTFDENQPRLRDMSELAYEGARNLAPGALSSSPYVGNAQASANTIASGYFLGNNPGQNTYDRLQRQSGGGLFGRRSTAIGDPSMSLLSRMATDAIPAAGNTTLDRLTRGGENPGDGFASAVARGQYLNSQPSAGLYGEMMDRSYSASNPYLDAIVKMSSDEATRRVNQRMGAAGLGTGTSSQLARTLGRAIADSENSLRYGAYNDAENRRLAAAGQSDAAFSAERGRMEGASQLLSSNYNAGQDRALSAAQALNAAGAQNASQRLSAAQSLGAQYNAGQDRALEAARASDAARSAQVAEMLQALGLTGGLRDAEYAGVAPTLSLLNSAADMPYIGVGALNGNIRQASNGYGTTTTKTSGGLGGFVGNIAGAAAGEFGRSLGGGLYDSFARKSGLGG